MPSSIEMAWARDKDHLTYITPNITELVGWTAEEIIAMANAHDTLMHPEHAHTTRAPLTGAPNTITAHTIDLVLRHKDGSDVPVVTTAICRYDENGKLVEMYGATRRVCPCHAQVEEWWKQSHHDAHIALAGMAALYPAA